MLDHHALRAAFFNPSPDDPEREPTREELWARAERRAVEACVRWGGDPKAQGLGEHGSLIGGPGKPLRCLTWRPEQSLLRSPLPLTWFDTPLARRRPPTLPKDPTIFFEHLSAAHLAGYPNRPSGPALARIFRSPQLSAVERDQLWHIFACIRPHDLGHLLGWGGLSVHETARAIHLSGTQCGEVITWINQFAVRPESKKHSKSVPGLAAAQPPWHTV